MARMKGSKNKAPTCDDRVTIRLKEDELEVVDAVCSIMKTKPTRSEFLRNAVREKCERERGILKDICRDPDSQVILSAVKDMPEIDFELYLKKVLRDLEEIILSKRGGEYPDLKRKYVGEAEKLKMRFDEALTKVQGEKLKRGTKI